MEIIRGVYNLRPKHRGNVVTIGNFDGVHLGHQAVIGQLAEKGASVGAPTAVMTFEPHPQEFFLPQKAPPRLTRFREKMQMLRRFAVDRTLVIRFDRRFASMTAEQFISEILVKGLGVRDVIVGDDFRFGHQRRGDYAMLARAGAQFGFAVTRMFTFSLDGERVSSTRVREALAAANLELASRLLGRAYRMSGRVARGDGRGRQLGFPTANIHLHRQVSPLQGVYAVEVFGLDREPVMGVANLGTRPTIDGISRPILEVHLLDFADDLYGRYVQVGFLKFIRSEQRFGSLDQLVAQIGLDVQSARAFFARTRSNSAPESGYN